jgi:structural maintenance of chromosome 1
LDKKVRDLNREIKELQGESSKFEEKFRKIRRIRNERLISFFNKIRPLIDRLYKTLSGDHTAQATLYLENSSDPCQGGIKYTPTPANKKFVMDAGNLSSGEKSIAALALFFSVNEALGTPIIFVDEIDAHLDYLNAHKLYHLLLVIGNNKQIAWISHRPGRLEIADMMLGVSKNGD